MLEIAPPLFSRYISSPRKPFRLFCWSHCVAAWMRSAPIVDDTHVGDVPEPSESRYWCISMAMLSLGSVSAAKASELPEVVQVQAPVQAGGGGE